jgi:hypothetical protein
MNAWRLDFIDITADALSDPTDGHEAKGEFHDKNPPFHHRRRDRRVGRRVRLP